MTQKDVNEILSKPYPNSQEELAPDPVQVEDALDGWGTAQQRASVLDAEVRYLQGEVAGLKDALQKIAAYPVHSEPMGGAMAMQDIAHAALYTPNAQAMPRRPASGVEEIKPANGAALASADSVKCPECLVFVPKFRSWGELRDTCPYCRSNLYPPNAPHEPPPPKETLR